MYHSIFKGLIFIRMGKLNIHTQYLTHKNMANYPVCNEIIEIMKAFLFFFIKIFCEINFETNDSNINLILFYFITTTFRYFLHHFQVKVKNYSCFALRIITTEYTEAELVFKLKDGFSSLM